MRIITDHIGKHVGDTSEPAPGSIVLTEGMGGSAWQRHHYGGRWHSTRGGRSQTWRSLLTRRNLIVVYKAAPREEKADV